LLLIKLICIDLKILVREEKLLLSIVVIPLFVVVADILFKKTSNFALGAGLPFVLMVTMVFGTIFRALYTGYGLHMNTMLVFPLSSIEVVIIKNLSSTCALVLSNLWISMFAWVYLRFTVIAQ